MKIKDVSAIEVLDSRGKPTVRCFISLDDGTTASSTVPSGASTGTHEAMELRDGDKSRYDGLGVINAVLNIKEKIKKAIVGLEADPKTIDEILIKLDGTDNKSGLGANATLAVSQALIRAIALSKKIPLWQYINEYYFQEKPSFPKIMFNVVNGGKHAAWNFDIQEFIIIPQVQLPSEAIKIGAEIYYSIQKNLKSKKLTTLVGDEGGFSPALNSNEEAFQLIIKSAALVGYENNKKFCLAIDGAASEFYKNGKYTLKKDNREITGEELINYYLQVAEKYQIYSFEDAFAEDDWENWSKFKARLDPHKLLIGDDLLVTNVKRIKIGFDKKSINSVLIKPNQIGTIKETVDAILMTKKYGWAVVISHRSGETEDSFIADLAYGAGADFLKTGAPCRSDRVSKYNRLIEIENKF